MILIALLFAVSASCFALFFVRSLGPDGWLAKKKVVRQRLEQVSPPSHGPEETVLRKKSHLSDIKSIEKILSRHDLSNHLALLLRSVRLKISVSVFVLSSLILGILSFTYLNARTAFPAALLGALTAGFFPYLVLIMSRRLYAQRFIQFLPNVLSIISGSIKVGHGIETALDAVVRTAPSPANEEFKTVRAEMKLGLSLQEALENLYRRVGSPELRIFITGIVVNQELGGNLSEILENLEKTIRDRFAVMREIKTLSAQGKLSSWVLFFLPIAIVFIYAQNDPLVFRKFMATSGGQQILWFCATLQIIGFILIRRVVQLKH